MALVHPLLVPLAPPFAGSECSWGQELCLEHGQGSSLTAGEPEATSSRCLQVASEMFSG